MLENCPICNNAPHINKYMNDGSFYHTDRAIISCDCGFSITEETYTDKLFDTGNGYDVQRNQYLRALNQATWKWNNMSKERCPICKKLQYNKEGSCKNRYCSIQKNQLNNIKKLSKIDLEEIEKQKLTTKEKTPLDILLDAIDDINYHRLPYWIDDGPVIVVIEEHRLITMENALINYRNSLKI